MLKSIGFNAGLSILMCFLASEIHHSLFQPHELFTLLIAHEIPYENGSHKQSRTAFRGRLRPNACIQPQCQCHSRSSSDQRSGWWHDSNIARGGPRRAWFGATLPVEVTLAFKLGLKWSFKRTATFTSYARHRGVTADCKGHELNGD